jgi:hypothetical protein
MFAEEVRTALRRLLKGTGQKSVSIKCDCKNLETVYVQVDTFGRVLVTDDYRTFKYLSESGNSTYVAVESIDMARVRRLCDQLRVELRSAPPDGYPSLVCVLPPSEPLADAVERVADAIEGVFALAMRGELK